MTFDDHVNVGTFIADVCTMLENFKTYQIAKQHHELCLELKTPSYLRDQLYRASASVALNLAEGSAKRSWKEQSRFFEMALGSVVECQAILDISKLQTKELLELSKKLEAHVRALKASTSKRERDR
jgi:four helix bundle protein